MNLGTFYDMLCADLSAVEIDEPRRLARLILEYAAGISPETLVAAPDTTLTHDQIHTCRNFAARLGAGEPLSRILGWREFYGLRFDLSRDTLDPRPDTEILVDTALKWLAGRPDATGLLDLGTGTGCIPIAILYHCPRLRAVAVDISAGACAIATQNADRNGVGGRFTVRMGHWLDPIEATETFDLITANPPYIPTAEIDSLPEQVRYSDPIRALDGGPDGYDAYRHLFLATQPHLNPGGIALFEIGAGQLADLRRIAEKSGLDVATVVMDYAGHPRVMGVVPAA